MESNGKVHRAWSLRSLSHFLIFCVSLLLISCANMGSPDGGWYDETPPEVVSTSPIDKSTGVTAHKISIQFNEYIKLDDVQNKVIVSPPQLEMPDIKASGKRILVNLKDSLKPNTTYTVDFSDAISDNNEGNPLGNYTYSFSTGDQIDTLEVSGYVLDAVNLEPIKGILVGLYDNLSDTIFRSEPMIRISRTDDMGHFTVKGVAPGQYRCYALMDADGDFVYKQKSEQVAFSNQIFSPSWKPDTRQDTIWRDSLHIDRIIKVPYTHFLPDDITLLAFKAVQNDRYLVKTERAEPEKMTMIFSYGDEELPIIKGMNFDAELLLPDASVKRDSIIYWLRDTALVNQDTLRFEMKYHATDTLGQLVYNTDTLEVVSKVSYEKRMKDAQKSHDNWMKEQEKLKKKGQPYDSIMPPPKTDFTVRLSAGGSIAPDSRVFFNVLHPLVQCDTSRVHLYYSKDSTWYRTPFQLQQVPGSLLSYELKVDWKEGTEYSFETDSSAFVTIMDYKSLPLKQGLKVGVADEFSTLVVNLSGVRDTGYVVQLINESEHVIKQVRADRSMTAEFFYVKPGSYYLRAFHDPNGNNEWDTGDYDQLMPAEDIYYYPEATECKAKWDVTRNWNLNGKLRFEQKPQKLIKQKGERKKKLLRNRNLERAKRLGKEYLKDKGVSL